MSDRIIRESICVSDTLSKLSDFEERFWHHLTVCVDDYGRFDARPAILKGRLFPLRSETTEPIIAAALGKLASVGLVHLYQVEGKPFLQIVTWAKYQRIRNKKSKYPAPEEGEPLPSVDVLPMIGSNPQTTDSSPQQIADHSPQSAMQQEPEQPTNTGTSKTTSKTWRDSLPSWTKIRFSSRLRSAITDWLTYKRERREDYKSMGLKALLSEIEKRMQSFSEDAVISVIRLSMSNGWKGITWEKIAASAPKAGCKTFLELAEQSLTCLSAPPNAPSSA